MKSTDVSARHSVEELGFEMVGITPIRRQSSASRGLDKTDPAEVIIPKVEMSSDDRDMIDLLRLGKTQVLKRNFGFMAIFGFACVIMVTWEIVLVLYQSGMSNGGPPGIIYGFILAWAGLSSVYTCLCELSSMAPVSSGQSFWVSMLAPTSSQKLLSYLTGWVTLCGWISLWATTSFPFMIQGLHSILSPNYDPRPWQTTILMWVSGIIAFVINAFSRRSLAWFIGAMFLVHILAFFAVIISLAAFADSNSASQVFHTWYNEGQWSSQGLAFMLGLVNPIFGFVGVDGPIHMAEEIHNAAVVVPRAVMSSITVSGVLGFSTALIITFTTPSFEDVLNSDSKYPFMEVLIKTLSSNGAAAFLVACIIALAQASTTASLAVASRLLWSFSRDRGVPFWQWLRVVNPSTTIPLRAVTVSTLIFFLLSLIVLGSSDVFNAIVSISIVGLYSSYLFPITLLLWRRSTGGIIARSAAPSDGVLFNSSGQQLVWGPWRVPGWMGIANNVVAVAFMTVVWVFSFWPTSLPVTTDSMNWSSVTFVGVIMVALMYYYTRGRRDYVGPVSEIGGR